MAINLQHGTLIAERFRLDAFVGKGGMAEVWAGTHVITRRRVALKFLLDNNKPSVARRFVREARAMTSFEHPNVVKVYDVQMLDGGVPFMVMELLEGETLQRYLRRKERLSLEETASLLVPVVSAVASAHAAGVVHRDLKPANLFLERVGAGMRPRVLDFGIAKMVGADVDEEAMALTNTGEMLGTPHYMAPEQVFGERDIDFRVDIWALGIILYQCLAGDRPFTGDNPGQIIKAILSGKFIALSQRVDGVPADIDQLIDRMLQVDRTRRLDNLHEVAAVLGRYTTVTAPTFGPPRLVTADHDEPSIDELLNIDATEVQAPHSLATGPSAVSGSLLEKNATGWMPPGGPADAPVTGSLHSGTALVHDTASSSLSRRSRLALACGAGLAAATLAIAGFAVVLKLQGPAAVPGGQPVAAVSTSLQQANDQPEVLPVAPAASVSAVASVVAPVDSAKPAIGTPPAPVRPAVEDKRLPGGVYGATPF